MRAAIYNPYLDSLGGGELYTITVAKTLADAGYSVDLFWKDNLIKDKLEERFGIKLSLINISSDINRGSGYDVCFWVSDGSIPTLLARKNLLHFQVPFTNVNGITLLNKMKLFRINKIICNSNFTKKVIDKEFGVNSVVIYPPVNVSKLKQGKKENIILYVGRFSKLLQQKRHDTLIRSFKKLYDSGLKSYRLILAGGAGEGSREYLDKLVEASKNYPIRIITNLDFDELKELYAKSKIFWSASGYGVDEMKDPKRVEHFGISVVEAMASGAVPIIYSGGGHKEIINDGENGYLWDQTKTLISKTLDLAKDNKEFIRISRKAVSDSKKYSQDNFRKEIFKYI